MNSAPEDHIQGVLDGHNLLDRLAVVEFEVDPSVDGPERHHMLVLLDGSHLVQSSSREVVVDGVGEPTQSVDILLVLPPLLGWLSGGMVSFKLKTKTPDVTVLLWSRLN
jgi:hypothetical protein